MLLMFIVERKEGPAELKMSDRKTSNAKGPSSRAEISLSKIRRQARGCGSARLEATSGIEVANATPPWIGQTGPGSGRLLRPDPGPENHKPEDLPRAGAVSPLPGRDYFLVIWVVRLIYVSTLS